MLNSYERVFSPTLIKCTSLIITWIGWKDAYIFEHKRINFYTQKSAETSYKNLKKSKSPILKYEFALDLIDDDEIQ